MLAAVADEGIGIPASRLPHIFTTFYRAHGHGPVAGSGIGLAVCEGLVEAHGGQIRIEGVEGTGTTVRFTLPLGERPDDWREDSRGRRRAPNLAGTRDLAVRSRV